MATHASTPGSRCDFVVTGIRPAARHIERYRGESAIKYAANARRDSPFTLFTNGSLSLAMRTGDRHFAGSKARVCYGVIARASYPLLLLLLPLTGPARSSYFALLCARVVASARQQTALLSLAYFRASCPPVTQHAERKLRPRKLSISLRGERFGEQLGRDGPSVLNNSRVYINSLRVPI